MTGTNRLPARPNAEAMAKDPAVRDRRLALFGAVFIFLLTFAAYYPAIRGGFIWDDDRYPQHPVLAEPGGLSVIWRGGATDQYYPMTFTSFWVERKVWGTGPLGYHLDNVLLHVLNSLLAWLLLKRLRVPCAWLAAALFALHPVHVESVAWVTERKNVLSVFFYLLAFLSFLRYEEEPQKRSYLGSLLLFLLSLLSKTTAVTFPAALFIARWFNKRKLDTAFAVRTLPFFLLAAVFAPITIAYEAQHTSTSGIEFSLSIGQRLIVAGHALWFYAAKLVWPWRLAFNYGRWLPDASSPAQWLWVLSAVALGTAAWRLRHRLGRGPAAALGFFALSLVPALGFFKVYPQRYSYVADHFQYLSSLGIFALAAGAAGSFFRCDAASLKSSLASARGKAGALFFAALLAAAAGRTWSQARGYRDPVTLWRTILVHNPESFLAHTNLGLELEAQGRIQEAIDHYNLALKANPDFPEAHNNLGRMLFNEGRIDEAIEHYNLALKVRPDLADAHNNLGMAMARKGRPDEALRLYELALKEAPGHAKAYYNIAGLMQQQGKTEEAIKYYTLALKSKPDFHEARANLATQISKRGDIKEAIQQYKMAMKTKTMGPIVDNNLGSMLMTQGKAAEAMEHFRAAVKEQPDFAEAHNNLANALQTLGKLDEAIAEYRIAIRLKPDFKAAHDNLGIALNKQGKRAEAMEQWKLGSKPPP